MGKPDNKTYLVYSRNNDINGNPYRLILTFINGGLITAYEARSSSPNIIGKLYTEGYREQIRIIHLTPSEYNSLKKWWIIQKVGIQNGH